MLSHAATTTHIITTQSDQRAVGFAVAVLIVWTAGYLLLCWFWPFRNCRRCHGWGKRRAPIGRGFRHCPRCGGTGYRLRTGRHLLNYLRHTHRASK